MAILWFLLGSVLTLVQTAPQQPNFPRDVRVTAIPGVLAAGENWIEVWHGADNADGILGMLDGSVAFAQEQNSIIRKLDARAMDSAFVRDTHASSRLSQQCEDDLQNQDDGSGLQRPSEIAIRFRSVAASSIVAFADLIRYAGDPRFSDNRGHCDGPDAT